LRKNNRLPDSVVAKIENLYFRIQPNYDSDINDFVQGNFSDPICIPDVPPEQIIKFQENNWHDLIELRAMRYNYIAFNMKRPLFKDPEVRRALSCAIDRQQLLGVYQAQGNPVTGPFPYDSYERCDTCLTPYQVYNPGLADDLLERAGWKQQPSGWRQNDAGVPLQIELITYAETRSVAAEVAQKVKGFWERVGVKTEVLSLTWPAYLERVFREGSFDAAFGKWEFASRADPTPTFRSNGSLNFVSYSNPVVDSLLQMTKNIRQDSAISLYHQLHAQISEDAPYAFLYTINRRAVVTSYVDTGPNIETWNFLRRINLWSIP
jgi:peptide/nickel transport system substrate-binding protein